MADEQFKNRADGPVTALLRIGPPALQIAGLEQLRAQQGEKAAAIEPVIPLEIRGR